MRAHGYIRLHTPLFILIQVQVTSTFFLGVDVAYLGEAHAMAFVSLESKSVLIPAGWGSRDWFVAKKMFEKSGYY